MISVLHVKTKKNPVQQTAKFCAVWSQDRLHEINAIVFVWLFQLLNTKRIKADPVKGERKLTVLNVGTVVLLAEKVKVLYLQWHFLERSLVFTEKVNIAVKFLPVYSRCIKISHPFCIHP
jgi:hypothetical protein